MVDHKLTMAYVASRITEMLQTDLFVIWSEDNLEKLIIRCRVMGGVDKEEDDASLMEENVKFFSTIPRNVVVSTNPEKGRDG